MKKRKKLSYQHLETIVKGFANHRRLQILDLLKEKPELSVTDIAEKLDIDIRTASDHTRKLTVAGLIMKRYDGSNVRHALTARGKVILEFRGMLE